MKKLINPWEGKETYNCIGCCSSNKIGLKLKFYDNETEIVSFWTPTKDYEGYVDILHGGIQSTLHDEVASWVIYTKGGTAGVTTELNVRFLKSVLISDEKIKITGKITDKNKKYISVKTQLFNHKNELCSEANVVYRVFSPEVAKAKMYYPGVSAFYK